MFQGFGSLGEQFQVVPAAGGEITVFALLCSAHLHLLRLLQLPQQQMQPGTLRGFLQPSSATQQEATSSSLATTSHF